MTDNRPDTSDLQRLRRPSPPSPYAEQTDESHEAAVEALPVPDPADDDGAPRRRKRASVGGLHLKLAVPERKGWHRRWVNDVPGRIASFEELAYTHVRDASIKSDGTDSRVRRHVGKDEFGQPLFAYLMETPEREYAYGVAEKAEAIRATEKAISEGRSEQGGIENRYGSVSIKG